MKNRGLLTRNGDSVHIVNKVDEEKDIQCGPFPFPGSLFA